jgi:hypothetical protein
MNEPTKRVWQLLPSAEMTTLPELVVAHKDANQLTGEKGYYYSIMPNAALQYVIPASHPQYAVAVRAMEVYYAPKYDLKEVNADREGVDPRPKVVSPEARAQSAEQENASLKDQIAALEAQLKAQKKGDK